MDFGTYLTNHKWLSTSNYLFGTLRNEGKQGSSKMFVFTGCNGLFVFVNPKTDLLLLTYELAKILLISRRAWKMSHKVHLVHILTAFYCCITKQGT